jgi:hypothetical protein
MGSEAAVRAGPEREVTILGAVQVDGLGVIELF